VTEAPGRAVEAARPVRRRRRRGLRRRGVVLAFMSPWLIGFLIFYVYPMLATLYYSFTHYDIFSSPRWVGFDNYRFMFTSDPQFWQALRNTVWMILVAVPLQIVFAVGCAMVLTRIRRGAGVYRTIFFLPTMVPVVAAVLGFVFLLNPSGPLDRILGFLHLPQPLWFHDPQWSKPGLTLLGLWAVGNTMIIFLAALLDVPRQLYEAADIEGANAWQRFRYITLPMISPVIFFAVVTGVIYGFQYFTEGYVAAGGQGSLGQPQGSLLFYPIWLYEQGFTAFHLGYASAMAWMLFVVSLLCTLVLIRTSRRWVHYQGGLR
jgi:multiple sugar transport system permease protein